MRIKSDGREGPAKAGGPLKGGRAGLSARMKPLDAKSMAETADRLNRLTKPPGSLGRLEEIAIRWAGIRQGSLPASVRAAMLLMAGDHGVAKEGVSPYPQEVTAQMVRNMVAGGAAASAFCQALGIELHCVDVGVCADLSSLDGLRHRKVRAGTANLLYEPAMREEETWAALDTGLDEVARLAASGVDLLVLGEMGIGNTTPSACLLAALTGRTSDEVVGRGTGLDDEGWQRKRMVVEAALQRCRGLAGEEADPLWWMSQVGGLEIAALAGACIGGAIYRIPVVVDGFIVTVAALWAQRFCPELAPFLFSSHLSEEQGHPLALDAFGQPAYLTVGMRLGEGTGAALMVPLFRTAACVLNRMATFGEAEVSERSDGQ